MNANRPEGDQAMSNERETHRSVKGRSSALALAAAVVTQISLKYFLGVSWFWSIVAGLGVLLAPGLNNVLRKKVASMIWEKGPTWAIGNLRPLDLKSSEPFRRRAGRSHSSGTLMSPLARESLAVWMNNRRFRLGDRMDTEALAGAGFGEASSVIRVRAQALWDQVLMVSNQCNARSFGGELNVVTMKGKSPTASDFDVTGYVTAFLFFARLDPERPLGSVELERIVIVLAGGRFMLDAVTTTFGKLATEMLGPPQVGSRGQRIWQAGEIFLVCEEEQWKEIKRTTFTWTSETLSLRRQDEN